MTQFGASSSLIKQYSAQQALTEAPNRRSEIQSAAREIIGMASAKVFIKKPSVMIVDPRVSVYDKALYDGIELVQFLLGECRKPLSVLAAIANISQRQADRAIKNLIETGYVTRKKSKRRGCPDLLVIQSISQQPSPAERAPRRIKLSPCLKCTKLCKPHISDGLCRRCRNDARTRRIAREEINKDRRGVATA